MHAAAWKIRKPKLEIRTKPENQSPNNSFSRSGLLSEIGHRISFGFRYSTFGFLFLLLGSAFSAAADEFKVPPGFEVTLYADDSLAHDIYTLTIDSHGRVVVAGRGYIKILHDDNGDGFADRSTLFANFPKTGARGLYFDGNDLICVGDQGVRRIFDRDGNGVADGETELWIRTEKDGEHAANGIVLGPDGWFYLICGNDAGITAEHVRWPGSPVRNPAPGAVLRISRDGKFSDVYAHALRNPYDLDFNSFGNFFTYDADGERDHHLPHYTPTRIFDIAQGMEHGWILTGWQHAWNRPESNLDKNVERLAEAGRGSPTGVKVYRHTAFPERYHDGLFALCWTYGRVYFFPLARRDSTYRTETEVFMEPAGDTGFAPVGLAVGPEGDLFVAIGGRGTVGSVYRVRYIGKKPSAAIQQSPLRAVLGAPQPLSSWSRARWVPQAERIGKEALVRAALDESLPLQERIRAVEISIELFREFSMQAARRVTEPEADPELAARVAWAVSRGPQTAVAEEFLFEMTRRDDPRLARAAWEGLGALAPWSGDEPGPDWLRGLDHRDRRVRAAAVLAGRGAGKEFFEKLAPFDWAKLTPRQRLGALLISQPETPGGNAWPANCFEVCIPTFHEAPDAGLGVDIVRLMQLGLGDVQITQDKPDVYNGFIGSRTEQVGADLRARAARVVAEGFPYDDAELNREAARLLAMLEVPASRELFHRIATRWTDASSVEDDIHFLIAMARLDGERDPETSARTARAFANLHHKMAADKKEPSRNWPTRVGEVFERLLRKDSQLAPALVSEPLFRLPDHALFGRILPAANRSAAASRLLAAASSGAENNALTPELIDFATLLPDAELFPVLRRHWEQPGLQDPILRVLARGPRHEDRERFMAALNSIQAPTIERAAKALRSLEFQASPEEIAAAVQALKRTCVRPKEASARDALLELLSSWSGRKFAPGESADPAAACDACFQWFAKTHPAEAARLEATQELNWNEWKQRLARIDWDAGNETRGKQHFEERQCHRCHLGGWRLGPDLFGIANRLSREDLFAAIVDPNREVSPTFFQKVVQTRSGQTYSGYFVYESPTVKLLQTDPDTTVRILGEDIVDIRTSELSSMPAGLLDGLPDEALSDFYAFIRTLGRR
jgi:putative heme-binding domain-containing protein